MDEDIKNEKKKESPLMQVHAKEESSCNIPSTLVLKIQNAFKVFFFFFAHIFFFYYHFFQRLERHSRCPSSFSFKETFLRFSFHSAILSLFFPYAYRLFIFPPPSKLSSGRAGGDQGRFLRHSRRPTDRRNCLACFAGRRNGGENRVRLDNKVFPIARTESRGFIGRV